MGNIEDYAQCDKQWKNLTSTIPDQTIANLKTQLVENEVVKVKIPKCMAWLDDEPIGDLDTMEDKVDNQTPQNTPQFLPSFEVYTLPVTYPKEVDETIGILMEVEPLDHTKLEDLGLNTCNHDIPLSSREIPSVDEPKPQLLPNFSPLDVSLGGKRGTDPPINPYSPGSLKMKIVKPLTIHTPPSPHVAYLHQNGRKAHLLEDKQIPSVWVFDEVTWMAFGGNTHDLGSFGEETDRFMDLHQIHEEVLFTEHGDGVASIKRHRRALSSDGVRDLVTARDFFDGDVSFMDVFQKEMVMYIDVFRLRVLHRVFAYSYNETPNFFNQPPQYHIDNSQQFDCCEHCGGPPYASDCQTGNVFYEHAPYENHDSFGFDQPSQFTPPQPLPLSELNQRELITQMIEFNKIQEQVIMDFQNEMNYLKKMLNLTNSNQDPLVDLYDLKRRDEGDNEINSLTKEPLDTLLMGDEVISTILERENDEFKMAPLPGKGVRSTHGV
ncbi:hypothetical protein Tco_1133246 [Tanacetum coccineum]